MSNRCKPASWHVPLAPTTNPFVAHLAIVGPLYLAAYVAIAPSSVVHFARPQ